MRQAYDYWQNQPGNYRSRQGRPRGGTPCCRNHFPLGSGRVVTVGRGGTEAHTPSLEDCFYGRTTKATPSGHPIAPTEFPRYIPLQTQTLDRLKGGGPHCSIGTSRGEYQPLVTSEDGYRLRLIPELLRDNICHWPNIHRFLQSPRSVSPRVFGLPHRQPEQRAP